MNKFSYKNKEDGTKEIIMYEEEKEIASINYKINQDSLVIYSVKIISDNDEADHFSHIGIMIFNELLLHLKEKKEFFLNITGKLAYIDTDHRLWIKLISFYLDFVNHIDERIPYSLECSIYTSSTYIKEINIPEDKENREFMVKEICKSYINDKRDLYFKFDKIF